MIKGDESIILAPHINMLKSIPGFVLNHNYVFYNTSAVMYKNSGVIFKWLP